MSDNNDYDNIDSRINMVYDAVYNKENKDEYNVKPIIKSNIELIDIKEPENFDVSEVFNNQIKYVETLNQKWIFKRNSDKSYPSTISVGKYLQYGNYNDLGRGELYNGAIHYILSETVVSEGFQHVLLPLMYFDLTLAQLKDKSKEMYDVIKSNIKPEELENENKVLLYFFITEHYFKSESLSEFLKNEFRTMTLTHWKTLLFQVFYTLHKLSEKLQGFRHNNLNLDAIRLYRKKPDESTKVIYKIGATQFNVPNMGFEIKITDFENSFVGDYVRNKQANGIQDNPYYDVHYFMSCLQIFITKHFGDIPKEIKKLVDDIIPARFQPHDQQHFVGLNEMDFDANSSQIIVPSGLLRKNNFFSEFINGNNMDLSASPMENQRMKSEKIGKKESGINYLSPTDDISDEYRMLGKNISNKKKSSNSITGSRSVFIPGHSDMSEVSEAGIFNKAEKKLTRSKDSDDERTFNIDSTVDSEINNDDLQEALREIARNKKNKKANKLRKQKREEPSDIEIDEEEDDKKEDDSDSSSHLQSAGKSESSKSSKSSRSSRSSKSSHGKNDAYGNISKIDSKFAEKLKNLPSNYMGEVPAHIMNGLPSLGMDSNMGMPQEGMFNMMPQMPQMPPMMPQGMPDMMSQGMPPMMPQGMPGMMPQGMPGMMPDLNMGMPGMMQQMMPGMMPQGMPGMMMGGGKPKYTLVDKKDFFF